MRNLQIPLLQFHGNKLLYMCSLFVQYHKATTSGAIILLFLDFPFRHTVFHSANNFSAADEIIGQVIFGDRTREFPE